MATINCQQCGEEFIGENNICNNCRFENNKDLDKMTKFVSTIETLALLKDYKEFHK